jgi:3-oxoadipate enol-lactonase
MPYYSIGTTRLYYQIHNPEFDRGKAVVFLHGLGSCGEDWQLQLPALGKHYRIIMIDLRGHGRSDLGEGWATIEQMAEDVTAILADLNEASVHVVGLSLGGAVALQLAVLAPDLIASLIAVNTFARLRPSRNGWLHGLVRLGLVLTDQMDLLGKWVARGLFPRPDQVELRTISAARLASNSRKSYLHSLTAAARFDLRQDLKNIRPPTLVIAGELDRTVSKDSIQELVTGIPDARLEVFPGSGHVTPYDAAERFNQTVLTFLDRFKQNSNHALE